MPRIAQNLVCVDNVRICDGLTMRRYVVGEIRGLRKDACIVDNMSSDDCLGSVAEGCFPS